MVMQGYRGLSVLLWVNADRLFMFGAVVAALLAGAYMGSVLVLG
jgi:hypothetical protein